MVIVCTACGAVLRPERILMHGYHGTNVTTTVDGYWEDWDDQFFEITQLSCPECGESEDLETPVNPPPVRMAGIICEWDLQEGLKMALRNSSLFRTEMQTSREDQ